MLANLPAFFAFVALVGLFRLLLPYLAEFFIGLITLWALASLSVSIYAGALSGDPDRPDLCNFDSFESCTTEMWLIVLVWSIMTFIAIVPLLPYTRNFEESKKPLRI